MHPISTVFRKEAIDGLRDKKALLSAMLFPLFGPLLVYFMMTALINIRSSADELTVPVMDMDNAPFLIQYLREHGVRIESFEGDAQEAVTSQDKEFVLIIPEAYQASQAAGKPAVVELVSDSSRTDASASVQRVQQLIRNYSNNVAALRLIARGVAPEVMQVIRVANIEIASKQQIAARALTFIPMYIVLAAFVSGMGIAVDSTAGERERSTLEALLIHPVERVNIVLGKWLAASSFAAFGMITTLLLCLIALANVPLEMIGLTYSVRPAQIVGMIASTLPLAFLATSMQVLLGIFAKSFKDAQSYIGLLVMLPIAPAMFTMFNPVATKTWMFAIPGLSQHLLLTDVMGGKDPTMLGYLLAAVTTLILSLVFVSITARLFNRESVVFT